MIRRLLPLIACVLVVGVVVYLRDPSWLVSVDAGFARWERDADGAAYRWTSGHASFFVRSDASTLVVPIRAVGWAGSAVTVSIAIDDRPADRLTISDERWHESTLRLAGATDRRHRRIDIRVNRTLPGNRGVQVGEIRVR
jgi:hypothetical protein